MRQVRNLAQGRRAHADYRLETVSYPSDSHQPEHLVPPTSACRPVLLLPKSLEQGEQGEAQVIESESSKR